MRGKNVLIYKSGLPNVVSNHLWFASSPQHPFPTIWLPWFIAIILKKCPQVYLLKHSSHTDLPSVPQLCQLFHSICLSFPQNIPHLAASPFSRSQPQSVTSLARPFLTTECEAISYTPLSCPTHLSSTEALATLKKDTFLCEITCLTLSYAHPMRIGTLLFCSSLFVHNLYSVHQLSRN